LSGGVTGETIFPMTQINALALFFLASAIPLRAAVDFAHEVVPILEKNCVECHGGKESKGGLSINTRELLMDADVIELGKPKDSLFIEVLTEEDPDLRMPPPDKKESLKPAEVAVLERWIAEGAPWEQGFTFAPERYEPPLKPRDVKLPTGSPGTHPIDLIIAAHLKKKRNRTAAAGGRSHVSAPGNLGPNRLASFARGAFPTDSGRPPGPRRGR
jgi:hypothetical protein